MRISIYVIIFLLLALSGCTTPPKNNDPLQSYNRFMFKFNDKLDQIVAKPITKGYQWVVPKIGQQAVSHFFGNVNEVPTFFNDVLSLKIKDALVDVVRFSINSTIGLAGFIDVASELNLPKNRADFGLTLAHWGVRYSPYFVIPFLGPSTLRDAVGRIFKYLFK